jgi:nucleoside-diphosphate-sugar epimerase
MYEGNVVATERVLDAAAEGGVDRIVYVSTVNVFGNTHGRVVDETYHRPGGDFVSYYDETKFLAHQAAVDRISRGSPIVIVQPGGVYGPNDHSEIGRFIEQMRAGTLRVLTFPELGFNFVHVEDVADGIVLAHDKGRVGQSYVLGGEITTLGAVIAQGGGDRRSEATAGHPSAAAGADGHPDGPVGGTHDGTTSEPARAHHRGRRRDVLGHRREGAPRAGLLTPRSRHGLATEAGFGRLTFPC